MNWYKFNGIFYNTFLKFLVPQRKLNTTFKHKGRKYLIIGSPYKEIGCTYCAFRKDCNSVSILKRGFCAHWDRKDKTSIAFKKI